jgi:protein-tyrosine phosphatase
MALLQSQENSTRLTQVGNISLLMKIDEIESSYIQKDAIYERERMWLVFVIIVASLTIAIIAMFYRSVKQKRHYEKLLFTAKKEELAFINSHDVRKHLTNILGIIDVIRHSDDKGKEYIQAEDHLFYSSEQLDKALKNISEKLDG